MLYDGMSWSEWLHALAHSTLYVIGLTLASLFHQQDE